MANERESAVANEDSADRGSQQQPSESGKEDGCCERCTVQIEHSLESSCACLGKCVAKKPWLSLLLTGVFIMGCASGFSRFVQENRADELWVAYGTRAYAENIYLKETWPSATRFNSFIAFPEEEGDDILQPKYIAKFQEIHDYLMAIKTTVPLNAEAVAEDCDEDWSEKYCSEYQTLCGKEGCDEKYEGAWSFFGDFEDDEKPPSADLLGISGENARCFERGPFCWRTSILDVFTYNVEADITKAEIDRALKWYPEQSQFCPFSLTHENSPCLNKPCQLYDDTACTTQICEQADVDAGRTAKQACRFGAGSRISAACVDWNGLASDDCKDKNIGNCAATTSDGKSCVWKGYELINTYPTGTYCQLTADPGCDMTAMFGGSVSCDAVDDDGEADAPASAFAFEPTELSRWIGGLEYNDSGEITKGTHFMATYVLDEITQTTGGTEFDPVGELWELAAMEYVFDPEKTAPLKIIGQFGRSFGDELGPAVFDDLYKFIGCCAVISIYLVIVLGKRDSVHSMVALSCGAIFSILLAIMAGWGLCFWFGVYFSSLTYNIPFLLLGLGVDDAFVIVSEYHRAVKLAPKATAVELITTTAEHAGLSIFITSFTDGLAFFVGSTTAIPALRNFCLQAGACVFIIFIFQITFVLAMLTYDHNRAAKGYYDCCCCCKTKEDHAIHMPRGCCYFGCGKSGYLCDCKPDVLARFFQGWFAEKILSFWGKIITIALFVGTLVGGIYGAANLYKDFKLEWFVPDDGYINRFSALNENYFATGEQFFVYTREDMDYFAQQGNMEDLFDAMKDSDFVEYSEEGDIVSWHHQFLLDSQDDATCGTTANMEAATGTDEPGIFKDKDAYWSCLRNWLEGGTGTRYQANVQFVSDGCNNRLESGTDNGTCMDTNLADNAPCNAHTKFADCVADTGNSCRWKGCEEMEAPACVDTDDCTTQELEAWIQTVCDGRTTCSNFLDGCTPEDGIKASRFSANIALDKTGSGTDRYDAMSALRALVSEHIDGDCGDTACAFPFTFQFMWWEEMGIIDQELWRNVGICVLVIFLVVIILIPRPRVSLLVFASIAMSMADVMGYAYFWGLTINGVVTVYVLISLGLAVDYSVHIGHIFNAETGRSDERVKKTLGRIAPSVFNAILSTFLAVIVLAFSTTYIFRSFFKVFFLVTLLAGFHGIWFLPVMLSLFGGDNGRDAQREGVIEVRKDDETEPALNGQLEMVKQDTKEDTPEKEMKSESDEPPDGKQNIKKDTD